jgi:omega-6 fatty acid desaturase (delta-12 desaturase)
MMHCQSYRGASTLRSLFELATSLLPFLALSALNIWGYLHGHWLIPVLLMVPTAGFLVRLFIVQHDCGHGSFFNSRLANDTLGRFVSLFTVTPYAFWRKTHNMHHAASGNLGHRGQGGIDTLTVREYQALSPRTQLTYRLYRNPVILLLLGIPFFSIVMHRLPPHKATTPFIKHYEMAPQDEARRSILGLDLALLLVYGSAVWAFGWGAVFLAYFPAVIITAWIGGFLFFIQHQFEDTFWAEDADWGFQEAALKSSSYYVLPRWAQWFTGNIGIHHVHHLCALIPNYRLQECLDACPELAQMNRLTFLESLKCVRWALWDEDSRKMIPFSALPAGA